MKKIVIIMLALIIGIWMLFFRGGDNRPDGPKQAPLENHVNSSAINKSVDTMVAAYTLMKNAFVEADTTQIKAHAAAFITTVDSLRLADLQKDTLIYTTAQSKAEEMKSNAQGILGERDITEMRKGFSMVSESLYPFLKTLNYRGPKLYWQNCPMAFGEDKAASWISNTATILNPYMGKQHPQYKATMLHCGTIEDSIISK